MGWEGGYAGSPSSVVQSSPTGPHVQLPVICRQQGCCGRPHGSPGPQKTNLQVRFVHAHHTILHTQLWKDLA